MTAYVDRFAPGKYGVRMEHWLCAKWEPGKQHQDITPPEGMAWYVLPPNHDINSSEIKWFPTGKKAFRYLMAKKDYRDLVVNPIARQKDGVRNRLIERV
ncbi:hypothetical protein SEA_NANOSMITE_15 [Mycobacterium phage Nanosmite]|nr:hypothetical protein SEA_NANOSMITE_15 [Mycobacterium phage Nanosmite]